METWVETVPVTLVWVTRVVVTLQKTVDALRGCELFDGLEPHHLQLARVLGAQLVEGVALERGAEGGGHEGRNGGTDGGRAMD